MAEGLVKIVLKAVDNYSSTLTGLNQGLELVGKTFGAIKSAAGFFADAIISSKDLIEKGGGYREQKSQLDLLAEAYNVNADRIIKSVKEISLNNVDLQNSIKIATRAISTGFSEQQTETVLKYVKKFTESTGESFESMSEQVFRAFSTGRFSILKQMGLFIESGSSLSSVVRKMEQGLAKFGEASFSAGDFFQAINTGLDDFKTLLGAAINDVPFFQQVLSQVSDTVTDFIYGFDTKPITNFLEFGGRILTALYDAFRNTFGDILSVVFDSINSLGTKAGLKEFGESFLKTLKSIGETFFSLSDIFLGVSKFILEGVGVITAGWGKFYNFVKIGAATAAEFVTKTFAQLLQSINETITGSDFIASILGTDIDTVAAGIGRAQKGLIEATKNIRAWKEEALIEESIGDKFESLGEKIFDLGDQLVGPGKDKFNEFAKNAIEQLDKVQFPDIDPSKAIKTRTATELSQIRELTELQRNLSLEQSKTVEDKKNAQNLAKLEREQKTQQLKEEREALKIEAEREKQRINAAKELEKMREKEGREKEKQASEFEKLQKKQRDEAIKTAEQIRKENEKNALIGKALKAEKLSIDVNVKTPFEQDITETLARTNWPAELQGLGEFLLRWIIAKARGERIPLVVSTF